MLPSGRGGDGRRPGATFPSPPLPSRDGGRFPPGAIVDGRYRVVGLLGRGGMGEVYRADDLRLDQAVALKFLPESVAADPARLAQFHNEVRVARQVTHKNVCRMHDIGEVDGRPFLSMEYVDGEDLSSLLRRIGRLPQDTAVEMARQLCAGLAAAHERGVLHRDLKPANVMVDGEGHVRLTDFGIAGTVGDGADARAGTPGYMAPEQFTSGTVSVQSDLFALGLVLYEMFTGKRGIEAKTIDELQRLHARGLDLSTTSAVPEIDPAVDRVIRRCLSRDPADRPTSALAVSAALPGGDPIAAALAAGETPSPEMVAASGLSHAIQARTALALLTVFAVGLAAVGLLAHRDALIRLVPFEKPPVVLEDRARSILESAGYTTPPKDEASGLSWNGDFLRWVRAERRGADRWAWLPTGRAPAVTFYHRSSPRELLPLAVIPEPTLGDPPSVVSGMTTVVLDTQGRLLQFNAVPPQLDAPDGSPASPPDWASLFAAAGLRPDEFVEAVPEWTPPQYADTRAAWTGVLKELGDLPVRIEAAAYRGRPVYFAVVGPWTRPSRMQEAAGSATRRVALAITAVLVLGVFTVALVLARNNLRTGRGDRTGAARLAKAVLGLQMITWALTAHHGSSAATLIERFLEATAMALLNAGIIWLAYLALEPMVRKRWPAGLIGWTRVLAGRWRDPLVGRDVLVGLAAGVAFALLLRLGMSATTWLGMPPNTPHLGNPGPLAGGVPYLIGVLLGQVTSVILTSLVAVLLRVLIRAVIPWAPLAFSVFALLFALLLSGEVIAGEMLAFEVALGLVIATFVAAVAWRFGVLVVAAMLFFNQTTYQAPLVATWGTWYAPMAQTGFAVLIGLAVAAFAIARGDEPLLGRRLLER